MRRIAGAVTRADVGAAPLRYQPGLPPLPCLRRIAPSGPDPATRCSAAAEDASTWWCMCACGDGQVLARPGCSSCASLLNPSSQQAVTTPCEWQQVSLEKPKAVRPFSCYFPPGLHMSPPQLLPATEVLGWQQHITRSRTAPLPQSFPSFYAINATI